jgi:hypothetical protein
MIRDLPQSRGLDHGAMSAVRGGYYSLHDVSLSGIEVKPIITVNQNTVQFANIAVNVLNNNGIIGSGIPKLKLGLSVPLEASNSVMI